MGIVTDFKNFAVKGNVLDLAVGVIIGTAFGRIVSSLVQDIIMPPIGLLLGGLNMVDFKWIIKPAIDGKEAVSINYGVFLQNVLDFVIVALVIFLVLRAIMSLRAKQATAEVVEVVVISPQEQLLTEIRDLLKQKNL